MKWMPTPAEVAREAVIVVSGAVLAALIISYFPDLKAWMRKQWR